MSREAMEMALDALVSSTGELHLRLASPTDMQLVKNHKAIKELRTALAQPDVPETAFGKTEPVAWMHNFIDDVITKNRPTDITRNAGKWTALYTTPQKKEWVGQTDEEAKKTFEKHNCTISADLAGILARAITTKLKEKNA